MRRLASLCLAFALLLTVALPAVAVEETPVIAARAYLLMDAASGQVLMEYAADQELPIASTTKIMTALLAIEQGKLDSVVTVGRKPYDTGGSTIYLEIGEKQTLQNLLYALMLESANDAAVAIAEHVAGSEEQFAERMNARARELGATHTHFVNSHGLHDPAHYSTARDLALIARYALQNDTFRRIIGTEDFEIPGAPGRAPRKLVSHNRLLGYYEGANGVKNGFTEEALLTNVASARRGDTEYIAVVLGAENRLWTSSMALLDFGFARYETRWLVHKGETFTLNDRLVQVDRDLAVTVERGAGAAEAFNELLPVGLGQHVGWRVWQIGGKEVGRLPLLAVPVVPPGPGKVPGDGAPAEAHGGAGPAGQGEPKAIEAVLLLLLWIGGGLVGTMHLNRIRNRRGTIRDAA